MEVLEVAGVLRLRPIQRDQRDVLGARAGTDLVMDRHVSSSLLFDRQLDRHAALGLDGVVLVLDDDVDVGDMDPAPFLADTGHGPR